MEHLIFDGGPVQPVDQPCQPPNDADRVPENQVVLMESYGPECVVDLHPEVSFGSQRIQSLYDIIRDMRVGHKVIYATNYQGLHRLVFPSRDQALMFKLRF